MAFLTQAGTARMIQETNAMISRSITDVRQFMHQLLSGDTFDRFLLVEAGITMGISWRIEGRIHPSFYDSEAVPEEEYVLWEEVRPHVYSVLRGSRLPLNMKIVLALPGPSVAGLMSRAGKEKETGHVRGMFLNILYQPSGLMITTGMARDDFSMDKTPEQVFDDSILHFLKKHSLA